MSIPEADKKTSSHQVVKVTYDTEKMHKFMVCNMVLSLLLILTVVYMTSMLCGQNEKITLLAKMVNELNYKVEEQRLMKPQESRGANTKSSENEEFLEHLAGRFDETEQDIKKIKFHMSGVEEQIDGLKSELKTVASMLKQQSKSSWQMKQLINGIKNKLQFLSKMVENIPNLFQKIPKPDFGSMKDKIKGTFDNIKESMGNMFGSEQQGEGDKGKKKDQGIFDGMRDRFQRGWRSYARPAGQQEKGEM